MVKKCRIVFAVSVVMFGVIPFRHPDAEVVPGRVGGGKVMGDVSRILEDRCEARKLHMGEVGRFGKPRMVGNAGVRRKDAACRGKPASVHALKGSGVGRERIQEWSGRRFAGIQIAYVQSAVGFEEDDDEVRLFLALCGKLFAFEKFLFGNAV